MPRLTVLIALFALGAAGCGANAQKAADVPSQAGRAQAGDSPSPTPSLSAADFKAKLLTLKDLPTGFASAPVTPDDPEGDKACPALADPKPLGPSVEIDFANAANNTQAQETVVRPPDAKALLAKMRTAPTTCRTVSQKDGTAHVSSMAVPRIGDESAGLRLSFTSTDGGTATEELVLFRSGDLFVGVANIGVKPDHTLTQRLADKAAAKLKG